MLMRSALGSVLIGLMAAGALMAQAPTADQAAQGQTDQEDARLTFDGDTALWTVAIRPDRTADFERVLTRLREALATSPDASRRRQAEGWHVIRLRTMLPDGNAGYVHVIHPVVRDVDYSVMRTLYDAFPKERQELYELYRGAFVGNVGLAVGSVAVDLSSASRLSPAAPAASASPATPPASAVPPAQPSTPPASPASPPGGGDPQR